MARVEISEQSRREGLSELQHLDASLTAASVAAATAYASFLRAGSFSEEGRLAWAAYEAAEAARCAADKAYRAAKGVV